MVLLQSILPIPAIPEAGRRIISGLLILLLLGRPDSCRTASRCPQALYRQAGPLGERVCSTVPHRAASGHSAFLAIG